MRNTIIETETINAVYEEEENHVKVFALTDDLGKDSYAETLQGRDKGLSDDLVCVVFRAPGCLIV